MSGAYYTLLRNLKFGKQELPPQIKNWYVQPKRRYAEAMRVFKKFYVNCKHGSISEEKFLPGAYQGPLTNL